MLLKLQNARSQQTVLYIIKQMQMKDLNYWREIQRTDKQAWYAHKYADFCLKVFCPIYDQDPRILLHRINRADLASLRINLYLTLIKYKLYQNVWTW